MAASKPLDEYTPHELAAGLMRGNRMDMQTGYPAFSAALVAADRNNLSEHDTRALLDWSLGFNDGIHDAMHLSDPNVEKGPDRPSLAENENYLRGRIDARLEGGFGLYPSSPQSDEDVENMHRATVEQLFHRRPEWQEPESQ